MECQKQKQMNWKTRLMEDVKENTNGKFITLTFSNEQLRYLIEGRDTAGKIIGEGIEGDGYELDNRVATVAVRRFLERWRKKFGRSIRHWLITEIGHKGTENIHIHGILWTDEKPDVIREIWAYGYIWPKWNNWRNNWVNERTVNYITKYVTKRDFKHKHYEPIILTSSGIGAAWTKSVNFKKAEYKKGETMEKYKARTGHEMNMPTYYRNKRYTDEQKEQLWIEKIEKAKRYVDGKEISIKDGLEQYWRVLKEARKKNRRLGYGDGSKDVDDVMYEKQLRIINQSKRIGNCLPDGGNSKNIGFGESRRSRE